MAKIDQTPGLGAALSFRGSPLVSRRNEEKAFDGEELVIVISPLFSHRISEGYNDPSLCVVKTVNGVPIKNLALHLVKVLHDSKDDFIDIRSLPMPTRRASSFPRSVMVRSTEAILVRQRHPKPGITADVLADTGALHRRLRRNSTLTQGPSWPTHNQKQEAAKSANIRLHRHFYIAAM